MLLNTHHPLHSKPRQKSCAAVQPDAQLVTMVIFNNATHSQSMPPFYHSLNELQTFHTNKGCGKNRSIGFHKVLNPPPPQQYTPRHTLHTFRSHKEHTYLNPIISLCSLIEYGFRRLKHMLIRVNLVISWAQYDISKEMIVLNLQLKDIFLTCSF